MIYRDKGPICDSSYVESHTHTQSLHLFHADSSLCARVSMHFSTHSSAGHGFCVLNLSALAMPWRSRNFVRFTWFSPKNFTSVISHTKSDYAWRTNVQLLTATEREKKMGPWIQTNITNRWVPQPSKVKQKSTEHIEKNKKNGHNICKRKHLYSPILLEFFWVFFWLLSAVAVVLDVTRHIV